MDVNPPEEMGARPPPPQEDQRDSAQHFPRNDVDLEQAPLLSPLLIEDTLITILSNMRSLQDLKSFRLVSKMWNRAATRAIRSRPGGWIYFSTTERTYEEMKMLIEMLETSSWDFPWNKFNVDTCFHHRDPDWPHEKQEVVEQFFRAVAPFIKELELMDSSRTGGERLFPSALSPNDILFPVLEKLNLNLGRVNGIRHGGQTYAEPLLLIILESNLHFVRGILANAPRLQEVQSGSDRQSDSFDLSSLDQLSNKPLQKLKLYSKLLVEPLERVLANVHHLHIRDFHLEICQNDNDILPVGMSEALSRFLRMQSDTLEVLCIQAWNAFRTTFRLPLPLLPTLRKLTSTYCLAVEHSYPALQELIIRNFAVFNFVAIRQPMEKLTTLELQLPGDRPPDFFQNLSRVMPNLRKLIVKEVLTHHEERLNLEVLAHLQHVEELSLFTGLGDTVLTGFSDEELAVWRTYSVEELKTVSHRAREPPPFLQKLRKLSLVSDWHGNSMDITDVSCRLVFLRMANLKCLDLRECRLRPPGISADVLEEMRRKFTVLRLNTPPPTMAIRDN